MQTKAPNIAQTLPASAPDLIRAYFEFNHLKQLYRQGWLRRGLPASQCETVAEHSFATALLVLLLCDEAFPTLDGERALRMALIHDLGEVYAGDFTPADEIGADEKHRREHSGFAQILGGLPNGQAYLALWEEFEAGETGEARLVRQVDRLEMALQAAVYERQPQFDLPDLGEFYDSVQAALSSPVLIQILDALVQLRPPQPGPSEAHPTSSSKEHL